MCWNNRVIYSCGHDDWGCQVRACETQNAFNNGTKPTECETQYSHPLHCRKVEPTCKKCNAKTSRLKSRISAAKLLMKEANETMERLRIRASTASAQLEEVDETVQRNSPRSSIGENPPASLEKVQMTLDQYEFKFLEQMKDMVANRQSPAPEQSSEPESVQPPVDQNASA